MSKPASRPPGAVPQWALDAVAHLPVSIPIKATKRDAEKGVTSAERETGRSASTFVRAEARGECMLLRTSGRGGRRMITRHELARLLAAWSTPTAARGA